MDQSATKEHIYDRAKSSIPLSHKLITLALHGEPDLLSPGEVTYHDESGVWFLSCPECEQYSGLVEHEVHIRDDGEVYIKPSVVCQKHFCDAHYTVRAGRIRECATGNRGLSKLYYHTENFLACDRGGKLVVFSTEDKSNTFFYCFGEKVADEFRNPFIVPAPEFENLGYDLVLPYDLPTIVKDRSCVEALGKYGDYIPLDVLWNYEPAPAVCYV